MSGSVPSLDPSKRKPGGPLTLTDYVNQVQALWHFDPQWVRERVMEAAEMKASKTLPSEAAWDALAAKQAQAKA